MKILRLTNSNDFYGDVADSDRGYRLIEAALKDECGVEVETIRRTIWPADDLPDIVERWVNEHRPDMVFLKTSSYWYSYESVPLKFQRKLGRVGKVAGDAGLKAATTPSVAHNAVFRKLRYFAQATIGGDTNFTVDYSIQTVEAVIRRVLRHEDTLLVVRGSRGGRDRPEVPKKVAARHETRRVEFNTRLNQICRGPLRPHGARLAAAEVRPLGAPGRPLPFQRERPREFRFVRGHGARRNLARTHRRTRQAGPHAGDRRRSPWVLPPAASFPWFSGFSRRCSGWQSA